MNGSGMPSSTHYPPAPFANTPSRWRPAPQRLLIGGGVIDLVLWIYGLLIDQNGDVNFVPVNSADNWLHFVLGVAMVVLGFLLSRNTAATAPRTGAL
nr:hypothetical protein GCM10017611_31490 [Rhodococcus wratislaviensis]